MKRQSNSDLSQPNCGAYQILLNLKVSKSITIGKLGTFEFAEGIYIYTGSAMRNLEQRVARHLRKEKTIRWHIDYLLADSDVEIIETRVFPSMQRKECEINLNEIHSGNAKVLVVGFGSSDCRKCPAHLLKLG